MATSALRAGCSRERRICCPKGTRRGSQSCASCSGRCRRRASWTRCGPRSPSSRRRPSRGFSLFAEVIRFWLAVRGGRVSSRRATVSTSTSCVASSAPVGDDLVTARGSSSSPSRSAGTPCARRKAAERSSGEPSMRNEPASLRSRGGYVSGRERRSPWARNLPPRCMRRSDDALATVTSQVERAGLLRRSGRMLACRREFEAARERYREGVALVRDAGMLREAAASAQGAAYIELRAGRPRRRREASRAREPRNSSALGDTGFYFERALHARGGTRTRARSG